eukprot:4713960-Prymnesium_polylepis.2
METDRTRTHPTHTPHTHNRWVCRSLCRGLDSFLFSYTCTPRAQIKLSFVVDEPKTACSAGWLDSTPQSGYQATLTIQHPTSQCSHLGQQHESPHTLPYASLLDRVLMVGPVRIAVNSPLGTRASVASGRL